MMIMSKGFEHYNDSLLTIMEAAQMKAQIEVKVRSSQNHLKRWHKIV